MRLRDLFLNIGVPVVCVSIMHCDDGYIIFFSFFKTKFLRERIHILTSFENIFKTNRPWVLLEI